MNHVDDHYIIDDLRKILFEQDSGEILIHWIPETGSDIQFPDRVQKSIRYWADHLPHHIESHKVEREKISSYDTRFFVTPRKGMTVESILVDDRGKEYRQRVLH